MTLVGPIPHDDPRAFDEVDAEIAAALGAVNAAAALIVDIVARCIRWRWWETEETHSPEHWVAVRFGFEPARCRRLVRIASAIAAWPKVADAFRRGQLNETAVDVVFDKCDPAFDDRVAGLAPMVNHAQLRQVVRAYPKASPAPAPEPAADAADPADPADAPSASEEPEPPADVVAGGWGDDGRWRARLDLGVAGGALAETALQAARRALFRERTGTDPDALDNPALHLITWADAFDRLCHAALDQLDGATRSGSRPSDRYQAMVHVDVEHPERSRIHLGPTLTNAQRRELLCDCDLRVILERDGTPVGKGMRQRVADPVLRTLIEDRDQGCRSCGRGGFVHIHHLVHWEDDGPTDPDNLCALCTGCHGLVHRGALRIVGDPTRPDGLEFLDRTGRPRPGPRPVEPHGPPPDAEPQVIIRERLVGRWL